jgi:peptidyl-prolyl cis-trans isomerase C
MVCKACGMTMNEGATVCPNCGAAVVETEPDDQTAPADSFDTTKLQDEERADVASSEAQETDSQEADSQEAEEQEAAPAATAAAAAANVTRPVHRTRKKSGVGSGMIIAILLVVGIIGIGVWAYLRFSGPTPVKLTARDMELLVNEALDPSQRQMISSSDAQRKELAKQLKQILALAYEAEKKGLEKQPRVKSEIELRTDQALGVAYRKKNPTAQVSDEEATAYLAANPKEFDEFLEDNPQFKRMAAQGDEMKNEYAKIRVMADRARNEGLDEQEATKLLVLLQRSQALAGAYLIELQKPEIEQYYNEHKSELGQVRARHILIKTAPQEPGEAAVSKEEARKKAQSILDRVRNGEDFAALAQQHSDDEASKVDGGDLGFFGRGSMVPPFEQAAFSLKPGEVSDLVETEYGFHIIKVEEQREPSLDDPELQDQVAMKLDRSKLEQKIEEIAAASEVEVAEDFKIDAPPAAPPTSPHGQGNPF